MRIDVIRAIAALGVMFYHVRTELWQGFYRLHDGHGEVHDFARALSWAGVPMRFMGAGVYVFFVVSGYCIHRPQAGGGGNTLRANGAGLLQIRFWRLFYVRRFLRIVPAYWGAVMLSLWILAHTSGLSGADWRRVWISVAMLQNYTSPGEQIMSNPSLWSLPVEMELYLVYPALYWLGQQTRCRWLVVMGLALLVSVCAHIVAAHGVVWLEGNSLRFWALWCAGASVAELQAGGRLPAWSWRWSVFTLILLIVACGSEFIGSVHGLVLVLWGGVGAIGLVWAVDPRSSGVSVKSFWGMRQLAWLGTISYSLYLIHYPLFHWAGWKWRMVFGDKPANLLVSVAAVALVIPFAWVFYLLIERPSHRLARRFVAPVSDG